MTLLEPASPGLVPYATVPFVVASLVYSPLAATIGGWVTGLVAPRYAITHSFVVGLLLMAPIVWSKGVPGPGQPTWYPWIFGGLVLAGTAGGAYLQQRRRRN